MVFGEITTKAKVDYEAIVRKTCEEIGFTSEDVRNPLPPPRLFMKSAHVRTQLSRARSPAFPPAFSRAPSLLPAAPPAGGPGLQDVQGAGAH